MKNESRACPKESVLSEKNACILISERGRFYEAVLKHPKTKSPQDL